MQIVNKASIKNIFSHTWHIYPIFALFVSLIWLWAFYAYHQPSAHQKLSIFFATEISDTSFINDIKGNYERENLRQITPSYCSRDNTGFTSKIQIAINTADILVLDETTLKEFDGHDSSYFVEINEYLKTNYFNNNVFYTNEEKDYGILLVDSNEDSWLAQYMTFKENEKYYITLSVSSKNLGKISGEDNSFYDNALTFARYLLEGKNA